MAARPIERNFIPHSTTLARRRMTGNRLGAGLGMGLAAFLWANGRRAFGGCLRLGNGSSREGAETRRRPVLDMMIIFGGLGVVLGLRWVRRVVSGGGTG